MITLLLFSSILFASELPLADLQPGTPILIQGNLTLSNKMWKYHKDDLYLDRSYSYGWSQKLLPPEEGECKVSLWKFAGGVRPQKQIEVDSGDLVISESPDQSLIAQKASKSRTIINSNWQWDSEWREELTGYTEVSIYLPVKTKDGKKEGSISCRYYTKNPPKGKIPSSLLAKKTHSLLKVGALPKSKANKSSKVDSGDAKSNSGSSSGF